MQAAFIHQNIKLFNSLTQENQEDNFTLIPNGLMPQEGDNK